MEINLKFSASTASQVCNKYTFISHIWKKVDDDVLINIFLSNIFLAMLVPVNLNQSFQAVFSCYEH